MHATPLPLSEIRVLDFTRVIAGPFATALLGDLGADIIKIEGRKGDDSRHFAPQVDGEGALFMLLNRGKRSMTLNLKSEEASAIVCGIVEHCDVVVENFRPGVAAKLGVDYATLAAVNPGLVYASISGFGQTGSRAGRPAYDQIVQAVSGMMSINGWPDGPPTRVGESLADVTAGLYAALNIVAALQERGRTGAGQYIDVAMLDSLFSLLVTALSTYLFAGRVLAAAATPIRLAPHSTATPRQMDISSSRLPTMLCSRSSATRSHGLICWTTRASSMIHLARSTRMLFVWLLKNGLVVGTWRTLSLISRPPVCLRRRFSQSTRPFEAHKLQGAVW